MKNLKIRLRLILGFLIVAVMAAAVGIVGIIGISSINSSLNSLYDDSTAPLPILADAREYLQRVRLQVRVIIADSGNSASLATDEATLNQYIAAYEDYINQYEKTIVNSEAATLMTECKNLWTNNVKPGIQNVINEAEGNNAVAALAAAGVTTPYTNTIVENLLRCSEIKVTAAKQAYVDSDKLFIALLVVIIVVLFIAITVSIILGMYMARLISNPVNNIKEIMNQVGKTGDLVLPDDIKKNIDNDLKGKDEIAECLAAFVSLYTHLENTSRSLELIADGDLTGKVNTLSEKDTLGNSLTNMQGSLRKMFSEINEATEQVSSGSKQVSDGAQALALGSTEQASSIEELASSIEIISQKTKENAGMANQAAKLSSNIKDNAEKGSEQMSKMMQAVKEIGDASVSISNVIKVIDDIAFQTNILALNAAVEAARAGQHGKGFAVVADEVRNLASKSAEAAKNTGSLIANSMEKAELGAKIADNTASSLQEIVSGINESTELVSKIASSSEEQSVGITQINIGIEQVAQVVQQNSATAEQSAAASEEMSGQATVLSDLVAQFKI